MSRIITIAGFCICAILVVAMILASRIKPNRLIRFGDVLDQIMIDRSSRVAIIVCWWWLGWHFLFAQTVG